MAGYATLLEEALDNWSFTRKGVIDEVRGLPEASLSYRPAAAARSARELVVHILESGAMMAGELSRPDGDFRRRSWDGFMKEYGRGFASLAGKRDLLRALAAAHTGGDRQLRQAGELGLLQLITRFDGKKGTRLSWLHHGISHEEYHRGQLATYARLVGRVPALTRRIQGGAT